VALSKVPGADLTADAMGWRHPPEDAERKFLRESTGVDPLQLQPEYVRLSSDLAAWNARYADALDSYLEADMALDTTEARLYIEWRERLLDEGSKSTESVLKARVGTDPRYTAARLAMINAEVQKVRVQGVVRAIEAKKEMLISLGAHVRKEMEGNPKIREQQRDAGLGSSDDNWNNDD
jgi:hypothetical protein